MPSDVIRVDVRRHLAQYGDTPAAVVEIASTIIHEATHVKQFEDEGHTEDGAGTRVEQAEAAFKNWVNELGKTFTTIRIPRKLSIHLRIVENS
jgi:hypothetical protein